jgi:hypothetical protein
VTIERRYIDGYVEQCETSDLKHGDVYRTVDPLMGEDDPDAASPWFVASADAEYDPERGRWVVRSEFAAQQDAM